LAADRHPAQQVVLPEDDAILAHTSRAEVGASEVAPSGASRTTFKAPVAHCDGRMTNMDCDGKALANGVM
jgi:hypothetical protein